MEAAIHALRRMQAHQVLVAVPVGARETCDRLARLADAVVCLSMPEPMNAVGLWYQDFTQTSDEEVRRLLDTYRTTADTHSNDSADTLVLVKRYAIVMSGGADQYDPLLKAIGDAQMVLLGEATHGTHEFYRERAFITRRLIEEKGFTAVAVEADWPDAYRINRFVRGIGADETAVDATQDFGRFPTWMWRNADVLDFIGWLRGYNEHQAQERRAGFYGLDLYSLRASAQAVLQYLNKVDPAEAKRARHRYGCFDQFGPETQENAYATGFGLQPSCERDVIGQLVELHRRRLDYASRDSRVAADGFFFADQNARLVRDAEEYYRTMFAGRVESWNLRDRHMMATLHNLIDFFERTRPKPRVVVWAHNSHLGDARATEMTESGELNVGQLVREAFGSDAVLVGFTTFTGTVTAATEWDGPAKRRYVRPALPGSWEKLFHDAGIPRFLLPLRAADALASALSKPRLERAIGVLYVPESERQSHYFHARVSEQFDYVLHFDETCAVEPLERASTWEAGEVAETYPSGL
jgi:erythromycin esterase-like protein